VLRLAVTREVVRAVPIKRLLYAVTSGALRAAAELEGAMLGGLGKFDAILQ
jgi:hypothetical protein